MNWTAGVWISTCALTSPCQRRNYQLYANTLKKGLKEFLFNILLMLFTSIHMTSFQIIGHSSPGQNLKNSFLWF